MVRSPKINSRKFFVYFKGKIYNDKICFPKVFLVFLAYINLFYIYGHLIALEKKKNIFEESIIQKIINNAVNHKNKFWKNKSLRNV